MSANYYDLWNLGAVLFLFLFCYFVLLQNFSSWMIIKLKKVARIRFVKFPVYYCFVRVQRSLFLSQKISSKKGTYLNYEMTWFNHSSNVSFMSYSTRIELRNCRWTFFTIFWLGISYCGDPNRKQSILAQKSQQVIYTMIFYQYSNSVCSKVNKVRRQFLSSTRIEYDMKDT